jgi:adenylate kinase family enzyme
MRRVVVVGTTGSGKSTLAAALAARLGVPYVDCDALWWGPGWTRVGRERFCAGLAASTRGDGWVTDGNMSAARELTWVRADTLVWLDYPLPVILGRLLRRSLHRVATGAPVCNGNRETLAKHLSSDSLFLFALRSHRRWAREYPAVLAEARFAHLRVLRFRRPAEADRWLRTLATTSKDQHARPDDRSALHLGL